MTDQNEIRYGGLSKVEMSEDEFHLGQNVFIRKAYAHLFASFIIATNAKTADNAHGTPWKAAKGGISFDILAEIEMPVIPEFNNAFDQDEMIWIIASLIRLHYFPYLVVSAISDISFTQISSTEREPIINPYETKNRIVNAPVEKKPMLNADTLNWIKENWVRATKLLKDDPKFYSAFKAFDSATIIGKASSSLITIWGAIEQLFSPNIGELKYRVSANLSSFLEPPGEERLLLFKELCKLYNERSIAAHTSKQLDHNPVINSWVHLRNALVKIIELGSVPAQDNLEELIFNPVL